MKGTGVVIGNIAILTFLIFAAAFTPVFAKLSVEEISPLSLGFFRFSVAALLFLFTLKFRKGNLLFERKDYTKLILLSVLCIPLNQFFFLTGIKMSYASHSGIIYSLNPVYAYLLGVSLSYEKFQYSRLISILLTVIGIFIIFSENFVKTDLDTNVIYGDMLLLLAVFTFSMYLTLGKPIIEKYGALKSQTFIFITGSILYIPLFIYDWENFTIEKLTYKGISGFIYLSVVVAYFTYFLWYYALKTIPVSKLTTASNISPVLAVLFSIFFLGEPFTIFFIVGAVITLWGVFIIHRTEPNIT